MSGTNEGSGNLLHSPLKLGLPLVRTEYVLYQTSRSARIPS